MLTPTFISQHSELATVVVFSYKTITRHLAPLGATANVEHFSLTICLSLVIFFLSPTLVKLMYIRPLAVSYGWTVPNRTRVKCLVFHLVVKL